MGTVGRVAVIATVALAISTLATPAAEATDRRPCISRKEIHGFHREQPRAVLEKEWEVRGLGLAVVSPLSDYSIIYPKCGAAFPDDYYGLAFYREDGLSWAWAWFKETSDDDEETYEEPPVEPVVLRF